MRKLSWFLHHLFLMLIFGFVVVGIYYNQSLFDERAVSSLVAFVDNQVQHANKEQPSIVSNNVETIGGIEKHIYLVAAAGQGEYQFRPLPEEMPVEHNVNYSLPEQPPKLEVDVRENEQDHYIQRDPQSRQYPGQTQVSETGNAHNTDASQFRPQLNFPAQEMQTPAATEFSNSQFRSESNQFQNNAQMPVADVFPSAQFRPDVNQPQNNNQFPAADVLPTTQFRPEMNQLQNNDKPGADVFPTAQFRSKMNHDQGNDRLPAAEALPESQFSPEVSDSRDELPMTETGGLNNFQPGAEQKIQPQHMMLMPETQDQVVPMLSGQNDKQALPVPPPSAQFIPPENTIQNHSVQLPNQVRLPDNQKFSLPAPNQQLTSINIPGSLSVQAPELLRSPAASFPQANIRLDSIQQSREYQLGSSKLKQPVTVDSGTSSADVLAVPYYVPAITPPTEVVPDFLPRQETLYRQGIEPSQSRQYLNSSKSLGRHELEANRELSSMSEELNTARTAFWKKDYARAERLYVALIQQYAAGNLFGELGNVYYYQGKTNQAAMAYSQSIIKLMQENKASHARFTLDILWRLDPTRANLLVRQVPGLMEHNARY
jgi:TolA-binding protein